MAFPVESAGAFRVAFRGRSELVSPSDRIPRRRSKSLLRGSCDAVLRIVYDILPRSYPNASGTLRSASSSTTSPFAGSSTMHCNVLDSPCFQIGRDSRDHTFSAEAAPERIFRPIPPPTPSPPCCLTRARNELGRHFDVRTGSVSAALAISVTGVRVSLHVPKYGTRIHVVGIEARLSTKPHSVDK